MLVGEGDSSFCEGHHFEEKDMLTDRARRFISIIDWKDIERKNNSRMLDMIRSECRDWT